MVVYNVTCNVALEIEEKWLKWINLQLNDLSQSEKITSTSILKLDTNTSTDGVVYALQYQISDHKTLQGFLQNEDLNLKQQIKSQFGDGVLHFSSQLEIIKQYP